MNFNDSPCISELIAGLEIAKKKYGDISVVIGGSKPERSIIELNHLKFIDDETNECVEEVIVISDISTPYPMEE